jgi:hypothetical protein
MIIGPPPKFYETRDNLGHPPLGDCTSALTRVGLAFAPFRRLGLLRLD